MFALAWCKGGHAERFAVVVMFSAYLVATVAPPVKIFHDVFLYDAVADMVLLIIYVRMSLTGDRWWPFGAVAAMFLTMMVHLAMMLVPELDVRADLSARMGLTLFVVLAILAGVGERWLAGERPVCQPSTWGRRSVRKSLA